MGTSVKIEITVKDKEIQKGDCKEAIFEEFGIGNYFFLTVTDVFMCVVSL